MKILILNGPNLNLLGTRETEIYGSKSLKQIIDDLKNKFSDIEILDFQSNHEGELIDRLHQKDFDGCVFNPAAYTHTSIALMDAIKAIELPVVEIHISDISRRESFRKVSYTGLACIKTFAGLGIQGYHEATDYLLNRLRTDDK